MLKSLVGAAGDWMAGDPLTTAVGAKVDIMMIRALDADADADADAVADDVDDDATDAIADMGALRLVQLQMRAFLWKIGLSTWR